MNLKSLLKNRVVKNGAWLFVLQFANTVLPLLTIPYVTRILGTLGYGQFSAAYNWITYAQVFVEYGYTLNGARKVAIGEGDEASDDRLWRGIVCSRAILFVISLVAVSIVCMLKADAEKFRDTMILMLIVFSVVFQMNWLFQGKQEMQFITIVNVIGRVTSVVLILLLVKKPEHVALYCFLYASTFLVSSFLGLAAAIRRFHIHPGLASGAEIVSELRDAWPLFASTAISRIFGSIGITILDAYSTEVAVGIYSAVYKIPFMLNLCFAPISQALFPHMSQKYAADPKAAVRLCTKLMLVCTGVFSVICAVLMAARNWLVPLLFGEEYASGANLVLLLGPQLILGIINNFLGVQTLVAGGMKEQYSRCVLVNMAVLIASNLLLCPRLGEYGTAWSALLAEFVLTIVLVFNCSRLVWRKKDIQT